MTTVYPSSDGYFQQHNAQCHKAYIISNSFFEQGNEFTVLQCRPQSPNLKPIEQLWDAMEWEIRIMDTQLTHVQKLRDAIMAVWTKISETKINLISKTSGSSEDKRYQVQGVPNKVSGQWAKCQFFLL